MIPRLLVMAGIAAIAFAALVWAIVTAGAVRAHDDPMSKAVDEAITYVVDKTGYSTDGLTVTWKIIPHKNLFYMIYEPPPSEDVDWYTFEKAVATDGPRPLALTTENGPIMYFSDWMNPDSTDMQIIVHEAVHVLQFHNGVSGCRKGKSLEHEAYQIHEAWLAENGVAKADWLLPGPLSRMMAEQCHRRWE